MDVPQRWPWVSRWLVSVWPLISKEETPVGKRAAPENTPSRPLCSRAALGPGEDVSGGWALLLLGSEVTCSPSSLQEAGSVIPWSSSFCFNKSQDLKKKKKTVAGMAVTRHLYFQDIISTEPPMSSRAWQFCRHWGPGLGEHVIPGGRRCRSPGGTACFQVLPACRC